ncbi:hypothetical protein [Merismopedia glauca]|uniref:hypothetical protein n=1 Tax=Merismopedia glauca TaxID=292586 RepID=UPI0011B214F9|nr:hypothetical protein [Merismopedia glauca]
MKKKDLKRMERELKHYSSTYRYANKEGKEQLSLHIWKLRQAIAEQTELSIPNATANPERAEYAIGNGTGST